MIAQLDEAAAHGADALRKRCEYHLQAMQVCTMELRAALSLASDDFPRPQDVYVDGWMSATNNAFAQARWLAGECEVTLTCEHDVLTRRSLFVVQTTAYGVYNGGAYSGEVCTSFRKKVEYDCHEMLQYVLDLVQQQISEAESKLKE